MELLFSFDDGGENDVTIAYLLDKYGFKGTFFIPTKNELTEEVILGIAKDHEIGGHTVNHPQDLKLCSDEQLHYEIFDNREYLQELTGQPIDKFCYPRGRYNQRVIDFVANAGYTSARTTKVLETDVPIDLFRYGTTIHCAPRDEYEGKDWLEVAKELFVEVKDKDGYFHVWGHSKEIEKYKDWDKFEELLVYLNENI